MEKGIFAITTDSNTKSHLYLWYYDLAAVAWVKIKQVNSYIDYKITGNQDEDYLMMLEKMVTIQKNGEIFEFNFTQAQLENTIK